MGCYLYKVPLGEVIDAIAPYIGAILIVFGTLMTFAGAKFLFIVISALIGFIVSTVSFALTYNLFIDPSSSSAKNWTIGLLVVSIILALVIVFLTYKLTYKLAVPIIAASAGSFAFYFIYQVTGIGNKVEHGGLYIELAFTGVGGIIGLFIGKKIQFAVKTIGTAFIGAALFTFGVSQYAGHLEQRAGEEYHSIIFAYLGGMIFLAILGSVVQWKLFKDVGKDDE